MDLLWAQQVCSLVPVLVAVAGVVALAVDHPEALEASVEEALVVVVPEGNGNFYRIGSVNRFAVSTNL